MRSLIATLSAATLLAGLSAPAFADGVAANHAGFATMHAAAATLHHGHAHHGHHHHHHHHGVKHHLSH